MLYSGAGYGMMHGLRGLPLALGHSQNDVAQAAPLYTALAEGEKGLGTARMSQKARGVATSHHELSSYILWLWNN